MIPDAGLKSVAAPPFATPVLAGLLELDANRTKGETPRMGCPRRLPWRRNPNAAWIPASRPERCNPRPRGGASDTGVALTANRSTRIKDSLMFDKLFHTFEKILAAVLLLLVAVIAVISVAELCYLLYRDITSQQGLLLSLDELFEVFGMFLIVLIAIELMSSIYIYMKDKAVHVEIMLLIAITALTRKIVVLDSTGADALYLIGLAALLGTLVGGYYLVKHRQS